MKNFKFIIFTNTFNPHMKPLAEELYAILKDDFKFVYIERINEERKKLGWAEENAEYLSYYYDDEKLNQETIDNADTVYFGANPNMFTFIKHRIYSGKLTLFHEERVLKHGILQFYFPKYTKYYIEQRIKPTKLENVYILAASGFLFKDLKRLHAETKRIKRFGYFPKIYDYDVKSIIDEKKDRIAHKKLNFLCCGRLIKLKHFDHIIKAYSNIKKLYNGYEFNLKVVGDGVEMNNLKSLVKKLKVQDVEFVGAKTPDKVREYMVHSDIFIASSDKREGWGAVINEAMNSGCVPVISDSMGAVPFLINGNNGLKYKSGSIKDLQEKVMYVIDNTDYIISASSLAMDTIMNLWNCRVSAERLVEFSNAMLSGKEIEYEDGPLSNAKYIK